MNSLKNGIKKSKKKIYLFIHSYGINMESVKEKKNPPQRIIYPIPPYNGFGSEEDSLNNVKYINFENKNIENYVERFKRDKHILRFLCKLISPNPSDEERQFLISFFMSDNSIQVYEIAKRNSGRISCKFYERKKIKNPFTNKYYEERDFAIGNVLFINKYNFKILEMDEYTRKYMEANPEVFRDSHLRNIVQRIRGANDLDNFEEFLVHLLYAIDPKGFNYSSKEDIISGIASFGVYLSEQEAFTLLSRLSKKGNLYSMEDLYNYIISN